MVGTQARTGEEGVTRRRGDLFELKATLKALHPNLLSEHVAYFISSGDGGDHQTEVRVTVIKVNDTTPVASVEAHLLNAPSEKYTRMTIRCGAGQ